MILLVQRLMKKCNRSYLILAQTQLQLETSVELFMCKHLSNCKKIQEKKIVHTFNTVVIFITL